MMAHLAKIFTKGHSQAVRLPAGYRFNSKEVYIRRDETTGDVVLSEKPDSWDGFFEALKGVDVPEDFPRSEGQSEKTRAPFEGWVE